MILDSFCECKIVDLFYFFIDRLTRCITSVISPSSFFRVFRITFFTLIRLKFPITTPIGSVIKTLSMFHHISNFSSSKRLTIISMYSQYQCWRIWFGTILYRHQVNSIICIRLNIFIRKVRSKDMIQIPSFRSKPKSWMWAIIYILE